MGLVVTLTKRELEVLEHVCIGLTRREIGEELGISMLTVKNHLANMRRTTGCGTIAQLSAYAVAQGIVDARTVREAQQARKDQRAVKK